MSPDIVFSHLAQHNIHRPANRWRFRVSFWCWSLRRLAKKLLEVVRMNLPFLIVPVPPAVVALWFFQLSQLAPTSAAETSIIVKVIETSVVGAALFAALYVAVKLQGNYVALLREMLEVTSEDIKTRGQVIAEIEDLKKTKLCIYRRDQIEEIAAAVIRLERRMADGDR
jgi:hypothetical protein